MKKSLFSISAATLLALTSIPAQALDDGLVYFAVDPCRIVDTREAGGAIPANTSRNFLVSGTSGQLAVQGGLVNCPNPRPGSEPLAISAYVLAAPPVTAGVLTAFPAGDPNPAVGEGSTLNFAAGQVIGNTTNITLCDPTGTCPSEGEFAILSRSTSQDVVVDVQGYFYPAAGSCSADMVPAGSVCVDKYEASVWDAATGGTQYGVGLDDYLCDNSGSDCGAGAANPIYARSEVGRTPSAYITQYQASIACANVGKRLPTTAEWQMAASGTPSGTGDGSTGCNSLSGNAVGLTGAAGANCVSTAGAFDMVGNVWEWGGEVGSDQIATEFTTTDDMAGRAHGEAYNNSGGGTPSTKSMFILDTRFGGSGINAQNPQIGFRCAR